MKILGVGIATLDIINSVTGYPPEDSEVRAEQQRKSSGGNVNNTLTVLSRLGHECSWAGMLSDDDASGLVSQHMLSEQIDTRHAVVLPGAALPTSYIILNTENGSRSIVHFRDLPEYPGEAFQKITLDDFDWIHFEGRNIPELKKMFQHLRNSNFSKFSLEIEKPRAGIEELFGMPEILIFSRNYVRNSHKGVKDFFDELREDGISSSLYCAWGKAGAWAMDTAGQLYQQPAWKPATVIDTLGAGDAFNAGVIDATMKNKPVQSVLSDACKVAGFKCGLHGFQGIEQVWKS